MASSTSSVTITLAASPGARRSAVYTADARFRTAAPRLMPAALTRWLQTRPVGSDRARTNKRGPKPDKIATEKKHGP